VQTAAQTQGSVNVSIVIIDGSVSEAFQSAVNEVERIGRANTANLSYQKEKAKPDPPAPSKKLFQHEVFFGVASDKVKDPEYLKLRAWFEGKIPGVGSGSDPIPAEARAGVTSGKNAFNGSASPGERGYVMRGARAARRSRLSGPLPRGGVRTFLAAGAWTDVLLQIHRMPRVRPCRPHRPRAYRTRIPIARPDHRPPIS
jgi:hypothetical protein